MRGLVALISLALLAGCGDEEVAPSDEEMAERVREINEAAMPLVEVVPEPILYPDIEANDLYGMQCAYAPGTSMGTRVVAREADAFIKIDGEMVRFAADPGSREMPMGSRSLYNGMEYSLRLSIENEAEVGAAEAGEDQTLYEGTVYLRDRWDRVVYQGSGAVSCGGS